MASAGMTVLPFAITETEVSASVNYNNQNGNTGNSGSDDSAGQWDTDNIDLCSVAYCHKNSPERVRPGTLNIPLTGYSNSGTGACTKGVAPGFLQYNQTVNDFPALNYTTGQLETDFNTSDASACARFAAQQDKAARHITSYGAYLKQSGSSFVYATMPYVLRYRPSTRQTWLAGGRWGKKLGSDDWFVDSGWGFAYNGTGYENRIDGSRNIVNGAPQCVATTYNSEGARRTGPPTQNSNVQHLQTVSNKNSTATSTAQTELAFGIAILSGFCYHSTLAIPNTGYRATTTPTTNKGYLSVAAENGLCPAGFHPRGEDSYTLIGSGTGRTLGTLTNVGLANQFWCRSDGRYDRTFVPSNTSGGTVTIVDSVWEGRDSNDKTVTVTLPTRAFDRLGRMNCLYTALGTKAAVNGAVRCDYPFPLPDCIVQDSDGNSKSVAEVKADLPAAGTVWSPSAECGSEPDCEEETEEEDSSQEDGEKCPKEPGNPPPPPKIPDINADPCFIVDYVLLESTTQNAIALSGIPTSSIFDPDYNTITNPSLRADLNAVASHRSTASPARRTTGPNPDPDGCANGKENQTRSGYTHNHTLNSRKENPRPTAPTSSTRAGTNSPPPGPIGDYSAARNNLAHQYASLAAENNCAVKQLETEALAKLLETQMLAYRRYLNELSVWAVGSSGSGGAKASWGGYDGNGSGASTFLTPLLNYNVGERESYAESKATAADNIATAVSTARRAISGVDLSYQLHSDPAGCVGHYDRIISRLATNATNAYNTAKEAVGTAQPPVRFNTSGTDTRGRKANWMIHLDTAQLLPVGWELDSAELADYEVYYRPTFHFDDDSTSGPEAIAAALTIKLADCLPSAKDWEWLGNIAVVDPGEQSDIGDVRANHVPSRDNGPALAASRMMQFQPKFAYESAWGGGCMCRQLGSTPSTHLKNICQPRLAIFVNLR